MNTARKMFQTDNVVLKDVQKQTIKALHKNKNIIVLSPCGSGKTEAAYLASKHWGGKVIYALPMKTLATSIRDRLNTYESNLDTDLKWTLQHSSINEDRNLENLLSVTTIDQVLSGYLGFGREAFIRGANIMRSHLILDEIQLFDTERSLLSTFSLLDQTVKNGNHFMLMTATMPDYLMTFIKERYGAEIVVIETPQIENRKNTLKMTTYFDTNEIEAYQERQIIVCNTQKEQIELLDRLNEKDRVIILNSKLLPSDREKREKEVMTYFGKKAEPNNKILIATQIIEAGMDISARRLWTSLSPIDSLIQREGRLNRWGGKGDFIVVDEFRNYVYDNEIVNNTWFSLIDVVSTEFTWKIQMEFVNKLLGPFYEKATTLRKLKMFETKMRRGSKDDLIRFIAQYNVIVSDSHGVEDFKRESISLYPHQVEKMKLNKVYRKENGRIEEVESNHLNIGETIIISGENSFYDTCGFRVEMESQSFTFPMSKTEYKFDMYEDYIDETWLEHAKQVEIAMKKHLMNEGQVPSAEIHRLGQIAGMHDLGKLTKKWQRYIGMLEEPMAHRPWKPKYYGIIEGVKHNLVSGLAIKDDLTTLEMNVLLQHHGRIVLNFQEERIKDYEFVSETKNLLKTFGWKTRVEDGKSLAVRSAELYSPVNKDWGKFIYLVGTLMKSDREAIINNKKRYLSSF